MCIMHVPHTVLRFFAFAFTLGVALTFFNVATAATAGYSVTTSVRSLESGQSLQINYVAPASSFSSKDKIIVWNNEEHRAMATLSVKKSASGSLSYQIWSPSTYTFRYERTGQKGVVEAESAAVSATLPREERYQVLIDNSFYHTGETVTVTYQAPDFAHDTGDQIALYDINQEKIVAKQSVGKTTSGSKAFRIPLSGRYEFQYLMKKVAMTPIKSSKEFQATLPPEDDFTLEILPDEPSIRETINVTFTVPPFTHSTKDTIKLVNQNSGVAVDQKTAGKEYTNTVTLTAQDPGQYQVVYVLASLDKVQVAESQTLTVGLPDPELFDITVSPESVVAGEILTVSYNLPRDLFRKTDTLQLVNTALGKVVSSKQVGVDPIGSQTFTIPKEGTYEIRYILSTKEPKLLKKIGPLTGQTGKGSPAAIAVEDSTEPQDKKVADPIDLDYEISGTHTLTRKELVTLVRPAVVSIVVHASGTVTVNPFTIDLIDRTIEEVDGEPLVIPLDEYSRGSGFIVNPDGYILTNAHVATAETLKGQVGMQVATYAIQASVYEATESGRDFEYGEGDEEIYYQFGVEVGEFILEHLDFDMDVDVRVLDPRTTADDPKGIVADGYKAEVLFANKYFNEDEKDIALLKIDGENMPSLRLNKTRTMTTGDSAYVFGFPASAQINLESLFQPTFSQGAVSAVKNSSNGDFKIYELDAKISEGSSGGPVLNDSGEVLGLITWQSASQDVGDNFAYTIPASLALETLDKKDIENKAGPYEYHYLAGLAQLKDKHCKKALEEFDQAVESTFEPFLPPDHLAAEYTYCNDLIASGQSVDSWFDELIAWFGGISPTVYLLWGGVVVLVISLAVFYVKLSSRIKRNAEDLDMLDERPVDEPVVRQGESVQRFTESPHEAAGGVHVEAHTMRGVDVQTERPAEEHQARAVQQPTRAIDDGVQAANPAVALSPELMEYVKNSLAAGVTPPAIKTALLNAGWDVASVDSALQRSQKSL